MPEERNQQQLLRLSMLLQLEQRARSASRQELPFVMLNETKSLISYQQAVLWQPEPGDRGKVLGISGVAVPDAGSPLVAWLQSALPDAPLSQGNGVLQHFQRSELDARAGTEWPQQLPEQVLWVPLIGPADDLVAVLLFFRAEPWSEADLQLFGYLADAFGHSYAYTRTAYRPRVPESGWRRKKIWVWIGMVTLVLLGLLPTRQSVLAPAEVVPREPTLVRAPLDGVVDRFFVKPNEPVAAGQLLFALDDTQLKSRLNVTEKTREIARTEYMQAAQQAFADPQANAMLAVLQGRVRQQTADVEYLNSLLERIQVHAPKEGIAIFDDPDDWEGRPVSIGQKIMVIADPEVIELEISLPVNDAITLKTGGEVSFFLNVTPTRPLDARLTFASYSSFITPENTAAYRLNAAFEDPVARPRIGLKGTAKLYGERSLFALWMLRKPLSIARRWLGI
jgi:hypothetical protein